MPSRRRPLHATAHPVAPAAPATVATAPGDRPRPRARRQGFTLIELLTVIAIIGILAAILIPTIEACRRQARTSREVSAARHVMAAFQMAADERRGVYLSLLANGESSNEGGAAITNGTAAGRWPHHLRPYLGNRFKNALYVGEQADYYDEVLAGAAVDYTLTLGPSFGMNGDFVGAEPAQRLKDRPVRKLEEAALPSKLIAFTSAQRRDLDPKAGYFRVAAPYAGWPAADVRGVPPDFAQDAAYGYVSYRLGGKAAVIFLDAHVELLTCAELRDMRLWSDQARRRGEPDYRPAY